MPVLTLPDCDLLYIDQGTGPVLLFAHGFPLSHAMWQAQIAEFARDCRVIAPDLRGFGQSQPRTGAIADRVAMEDFADDLAALLDALAITEPVTFCGLSMGGYIGWQFWRRHSARIERLIMCDTRAAADSQEGARGRLETAQKVLADGPEAITRTMLPKLLAPGTMQRRPDLVESLRRVMMSTPPRTIAAALRGMAVRPDATGWLRDIAAPVLFICGEHDAISPPAEMQTLAAAVPHGVWVEVPDAGHMAPLENPAVVNAAIRTFLRQAPSASGEPKS